MIQDVVYDIMLIVPHIVGRHVKCWCGKDLLKGTAASMAVLSPGDGYWPGHKVICSPDCPMVVKQSQSAGTKTE